MKENQTHAYSFVDEKEKLGMGTIYKVKIGKDGKKAYKVAGYQLAQAEHFRQFLEAHFKMLTFTFHGDGFLRDIYDDFVESNNLGAVIQ